MLGRGTQDVVVDGAESFRSQRPCKRFEGPGEDDGQDEQQPEQGTAEFNESIIAGCEAGIGDPWEGSARGLLSLEAVSAFVCKPLVRVLLRLLFWVSSHTRSCP